MMLFAIGFFVLCFSPDICLSYGSQMEPSKPKQHATDEEACPVITVSRDHKISARIADRPLDAVLLAMSGKDLFAIKGALPYGQTVSVILVGATVETALAKLLRGYNYVIVKQDPDEKRLLVLMGKAVRSKSIERGAPMRRAVGISVKQSPEPKRYYVPPVPRQQPETTNSGSTFSAGRLTGRAVQAVPLANQATRTQGPPNQQSGKAVSPSVPENTGVKF